MELIIIKSGEEYIRVKDGSYLLVQLDKASVFPLDKIDLVRCHEEELDRSGYQDVCVKKLILTEEDFN